MSPDRTFVDSNVLLYLISPDAAKRNVALALLPKRPHLSVQVLNEVTNVCRKKAGMSWQEIADFLSDVRHFCPVTSLTETMHDASRRIAQRYGMSFHDANILAAAIDVGATTVWSEDMHHGLIVESSVSVVNPFRQTALAAPTR